MQAATRLTNNKLYMVSIPKTDTKRFKTIIKALGWQWQDSDEVNYQTMQAIDELDNG